MKKKIESFEDLDVYRSAENFGDRQKPMTNDNIFSRG